MLTGSNPLLCRKIFYALLRDKMSPFKVVQAADDTAKKTDEERMEVDTKEAVSARAKKSELATARANACNAHQ